MKVHGNYYHNGDHGKIKKEFNLDIELADKVTMKRAAAEILRGKDDRFRGIREFFVDNGETKLPERIVERVDNKPTEKQINLIIKDLQIKIVKLEDEILVLDTIELGRVSEIKELKEINSGHVKEIVALIDDVRKLKEIEDKDAYVKKTSISTPKPKKLVDNKKKKGENIDKLQLLNKK